jgi:hypothetical protein
VGQDDVRFTSIISKTRLQPQMSNVVEAGIGQGLIAHVQQQQQQQCVAHWIAGALLALPASVP